MDGAFYQVGFTGFLDTTLTIMKLKNFRGSPAIFGDKPTEKVIASNSSDIILASIESRNKFPITSIAGPILKAVSYAAAAFGLKS